MPSQKLLDVVESLSRTARERLQLFVRSPYHNTKFNGEKVIELLDIILKAGAVATAAELDKKRLNNYFFPDRQYREKAKNPIDSLASDLFSLVRQFILWEDAQLKRDKGREQLAMARFYRENSLEDRFWQVVGQFRKQHQKIAQKTSDHYLLAYWMEEEVAKFESIFNTYTDDANILTAQTHLDSFYTVAKLEMTSVLRFQQMLGQVSTGETQRLSEALMREFPKYEAIQTPLAQLYFQVIQLLEKPDDQALFAEFNENCRRYKKAIPADKYRNLMAFYRYFMGLQYQQEVAGVDLVNRLFSLYKEHLAAGYFHVGDDQLLPASLKLMVNIALKVGENKWAEQLLKKYTPDRITGTRYPVESHSLCEAEVLFANADYEAAQDHLMYRNFENVNYSILADILLIKIYFVSDNDLLENRIRALEQKVRRSKLVAEGKKPYLNFLKIINKVIKYENRKSSKQWQNLAIDVQQLVPLIEREWLAGIIRD